MYQCAPLKKGEKTRSPYLSLMINICHLEIRNYFKRAHVTMLMKVSINFIHKRVWWIQLYNLISQNNFSDVLLTEPKLNRKIPVIWNLPSWPIYLPIYLSIYPSIYLFIYLSIYTYIYIYIIYIIGIKYN